MVCSGHKEKKQNQLDSYWYWSAGMRPFFRLRKHTESRLLMYACGSNSLDYLIKFTFFEVDSSLNLQAALFTIE